MRYFVGHLVNEGCDHYLFDWTAETEPPSGRPQSTRDSYWAEVFERHPPPEDSEESGPGLAGTWLYLEDYMCVGVLVDKRTVVLEAR